MRTFRIALTGDFLNEQGASAYGDLILSLWDEKPFIQYHFLKDVTPFAMRALAYSPHADPTQAREMGAELVTFDQMLRESDFLSLHCRLTSQTRRMIGAAQLALMKPT